MNMNAVTEYGEKNNNNNMRIDLSEYRVNHHSQCGEDGVIEKLFEIAGITSGHLVEFGAWDGIYLSNTHYHYKKNMNFTPLLIEENPERFENLRRHFSETNAILLKTLVGTEGDTSLNAIFSKYNIEDIALLSIDVDGEDLNIWNALDKDKFRPKIVIIEEAGWTDRDRVDYLNKCFSEFGYNIIHVTGNFIFIRSDLGIFAEGDIHHLLQNSGSLDRDLHVGKITKAEYDEYVRITQGNLNIDFFKFLASPQIINYNE